MCILCKLVALLLWSSTASLRHKDLVLPVQPLNNQIIALFSSVPWPVDGCLLSWERLCVCNAKQLFTVYSFSSLKLLFNHDSLTMLLICLDQPPAFSEVSCHVGASACGWLAGSGEVPLCQKQGNSEFHSWILSLEWRGELALLRNSTSCAGNQMQWWGFLIL